MILLSLLLGLARAETSWYLVPNLAYDSDDGLGFGARFEHARLDEELTPYRRAWVVHLFSSLRGYHHHRVRYDRLGLGADGQGRFTAHLAWRQWSNDGYWGIGNDTVREEDPDEKRYRYTLLQPFAHLAWRRPLMGEALFGYLAFNPKLSLVRTYEGSLLAEERPYGIEGGFLPQVLVGLQHDTREPELSPHRGHLLEVGGRLAPWGTGEAGGFSGVMLSGRAFTELGSERLVLAGRLMGELLWGQIPFYEMVHWGGYTPVQGVGGFETVRGLSFGRFRAPGKAIANTELRIRAVDGMVKQTRLGLELAPFVDLGTVFLGEGGSTAFPLHPAAGLGTRLVMDETFVGRLDLGAGLDPVQEGEEVVQELTLGIYVVFDHPF